MITFGQSNLPGWLMLLVCNQEVKLDIDWKNQSIVVIGLEKHLKPWLSHIKVSMTLLPDGGNYSYILNMIDRRYNLPLQEVAALLNYPAELIHLLEQVRSFSMENFNDGICSTLELIYDCLQSVGSAQLNQDNQSKPDFLPDGDELNASFNMIIRWLYNQAVVVDSPTVDIDESTVVFSFSVKPIGTSLSTAVDLAFRLIEGKESVLETQLRSLWLDGLTKNNDRIELRFAKRSALAGKG